MWNMTLSYGYLEDWICSFIKKKKKKQAYKNQQQTITALISRFVKWNKTGAKALRQF